MPYCLTTPDINENVTAASIYYKRVTGNFTKIPFSIPPPTNVLR